MGKILTRRDFHLVRAYVCACIRASERACVRVCVICWRREVLLFLTHSILFGKTVVMVGLAGHGAEGARGDKMIIPDMSKWIRGGISNDACKSVLF